MRCIISPKLKKIWEPYKNNGNLRFGLVESLDL